MKSLSIFIAATLFTAGLIQAHAEDAMTASAGLASDQTTIFPTDLSRITGDRKRGFFEDLRSHHIRFDKATYELITQSKTPLNLVQTIKCGDTIYYFARGNGADIDLSAYCAQKPQEQMRTHLDEQPQMRDLMVRRTLNGDFDFFFHDQTKAGFQTDGTLAMRLLALGNLLKILDDALLSDTFASQHEAIQEKMVELRAIQDRLSQEEMNLAK